MNAHEISLGQDHCFLTRYPGIDFALSTPERPLWKAHHQGRARCDDPSSDRTLRVAAFSRKGCDSETRGSRWRPKGEKGEEDRRCAWAHAPNPAAVQW